MLVNIPYMEHMGIVLSIICKLCKYFDHRNSSSTFLILIGNFFETPVHDGLVEIMAESNPFLDQPLYVMTQKHQQTYSGWWFGTWLL
jgi:hypothetical protein